MPASAMQPGAPDSVEEDANEEASGARGVGVFFSGGGARGISYCGALLAFRLHLEEHGMHIRASSGVSVGAIVAFVALCGLPSRDMINIVLRNRCFDDVLATVDFTLFQRQHGLNDGAYLRESIVDVMRAALHYLNPFAEADTISFEQLQGLIGERQFALSAFDLVTSRNIEFSSALTPHARVADAIQASMCIPLLFCPVRIHGMVLVDGCIGSPAVLPRDDTDFVFTLSAPAYTRQCESLLHDNAMLYIKVLIAAVIPSIAPTPQATQIVVNSGDLDTVDFGAPKTRFILAILSGLVSSLAQLGGPADPGRLSRHVHSIEKVEDTGDCRDVAGLDMVP